MEQEFKINGKSYNLHFDTADTLMTALRNNGFTEVKEGCGEGECGACVVLLNGEPVSSCQVLAMSALNKDILTVKGVGTLHKPHPIQLAFSDVGAVQCGFCTPAKVLCAYALLNKTLSPSEEEIRRAFDGTICRCTGYVKIIEAVNIAAERMRNEKRI